MRKLKIDTNRIFKKLGEGIIRFRWWIIIVVIIVNIIAGFGITKLKRDSSQRSFLLESSQLKKAEDAFNGVFGNDEFVALLIEGEDVFAPQSLTMIRELGNELKAKVPFADKVTSLADFEYSTAKGDEISIGNLVPEVIPASPGEIEAIRRKAFSKHFLINRLFSDDSRQTWLVLHLASFPDDWKSARQDDPRLEVGKTVLDLLGQDKYKTYSIKAVGKPIREYEDSIYLNREAKRMIMLAVLLTIVMLSILVRSFRGVVIPLMTTASSMFIVFGFMGHLGIKINQILITLPIYLGLALSIAYSNHLYNFFNRNFQLTGKRKESIPYALEHTGWPIFFTALVTISSLFAFNFVPIKPIQWVGFTSGVLIFVIYLIILFFYPALLSFGRDKKPKPEYTRTKELWTDKFYVGLGKWVLNNSRTIVIGFVLLVILGIYGVTRLEVNTDFRRTFGFKLPHIAKLNYVSQTKIGSMLSYNLTLHFQEAEKIKDPGVLKNFDKLASNIKSFQLSKRVSSVLDIIKDMNRLFNGDSPQYYRIPDTREMISQLLLIYETSGGKELEKWIDSDYSILRLFVETRDFDNREMLAEFNAVKRLAAELFPEAEMNLVGNMVESVAINDLISIGQVNSFLAALAAVWFFMVLVFRSLKMGFIALIPNITPPIFVIGLMGLLGIPLDFMTMTIMPMLLGLTVDDTMHVIIHAQMEYKKSRNLRQALLDTTKTVGKAIIMTSSILGLSFLVYITSKINVFVYLGVFTFVGILSGVLADFLITPLLVVWTKPFKNKTTKNSGK